MLNFGRKNADLKAIRATYKDAIEYLDENYAYFLTDVLNIGTPKWTEMIPTAAVALPEGKEHDPKDGFEFIFNPRFADDLNTEGMSFVLAHETMHIVLHHLSLFKSFDRQDIANLSADAVINDYLAAAGIDPIEGVVRGPALVGFDCSNSTVTEVYNIIDNDEDLQNKLGLGDTCPNCGGDTGEGGGQSDDGSDESDEEDEDGSGGSEQGEDSEGGQDESEGSGKGDEQGGEGSDGDEQDDGQDDEQGGKGESGNAPDNHQHSRKGKPCNCDGPYKIIDTHDWLHNPEDFKKFMKTLEDNGITPDSLPDDLEDIRDESANAWKKTSMAGKGEGARNRYMEEASVSMKWLELLEKVDPDIFPRSGAGPRPITTWRKPRRKTHSMYPNILLPDHEDPDEGPRVRRTTKKPSIVLALDTSGSIGDVTANKFVNLAKSIPRDKVHLHACTFTDYYRELDLDEPSWRSGGTCFSAIEEFIREVVLPSTEQQQYPKAVVVVTDGYATFRRIQPTSNNAAGWSWLLLDEYQKETLKNNLGNGTHGFDPNNFDVLDEFVEGDLAWHL